MRASIMATVNTLAGDLYDLEERGRVQGWLSSVWGVSAVFGPTLGGSLAQYVSWRWIFVINLPLGAAAVALIGRFLHEQVTRTRRRIDVAGVLTVLLAAGALIFGLLQGGVAWPWWSPPSVAVFAVAVAAAAAAVLAERRAAEPIVPPWFWRRRVLAGSGVTAIGLGLLIIGPSTFLPTYGQSVLGLGAVAAGGVLAAMCIGWPIASCDVRPVLPAAGISRHRADRRRDLPGRDGLLPDDHGQRAGVAAGGEHLRARLRARAASPCATVVGPQATVTWRERGVVTGTVMFCRFLGQSVGAAIFGAVFNATLGSRLAAAPASLRGHLPAQVNQVGGALTRPAGLGQAAAAYLRAAITAATRDVYWGLAAAAAATLIAAAVMVPRRFATTTGAAASTGAAQGAPAAPPGPEITS